MGRWVLPAAPETPTTTQPKRRWATKMNLHRGLRKAVLPFQPELHRQTVVSLCLVARHCNKPSCAGKLATEVGNIVKKIGKQSATEKAVDVQSVEGPNEMSVDDVPKQSDTADPSAQASTTQSAFAKKKKRACKKQQPSDESAAPAPPTAAPQTRRREICEWIVAEL